MHVDDVECVRTVYRLLREEGLFLGSTSGINVAAAVQVARRLGPGHTIVTILCDSGAKYQSRLFNRKWLRRRVCWMRPGSISRSRRISFRPCLSRRFLG